MIVKKPVAALAAAACSVALACTALVTPAGAAPTPISAAEKAAPVSPLVRGLNGPRQISLYGSRMYVAESDTGQVSYIDPKTGGMRVAVRGLAAPQGVVRIKGKIYVAVGGAAPDASTGAASPAIMVAKPGKTAKKFADLLKYELKHNPDHQTQFVNGQPVDALSNPYYLLKNRHGFLLVADAGGNDVLKVSSKGKVSKFYVPKNITSGACKTTKNNTKSGYGCDPVPTGLAYGPHGRVYVSALASEVPGQGRVYVLNGKSGKLIKTIKGLSGPTGVAVSKKGTVYASELLEGAPAGDGPPPAGFDPSTVGQIVRISPSGKRTYAQVTMPSGLTMVGGQLFASTWSVASFLGIKDAGQVAHVRQVAFKKK